MVLEREGMVLEREGMVLEREGMVPERECMVRGREWMVGGGSIHGVQTGVYVQTGDAMEDGEHRFDGFNSKCLLFHSLHHASPCVMSSTTQRTALHTHHRPSMQTCIARPQNKAPPLQHSMPTNKTARIPHATPPGSKHITARIGHQAPANTPRGGDPTHQSINQPHGRPPPHSLTPPPLSLSFFSSLSLSRSNVIFGEVAAIAGYLPPSETRFAGSGGGRRGTHGETCVGLSCAFRVCERRRRRRRWHWQW